MANTEYIFLVEDDQNFGSMLKSYLELHDFKVTWLTEGNNAVKEFLKGSFSLCILDVMLPGMTGFSIAEKIREINRTIPLIFLTAKSLKADVLKGFGTGADDYITKPFDSEVLLCKIRALLTRYNTSGDSKHGNMVAIGSYLFNPHTRELSFQEHVTRLSPKENALLRLLCERKNDILSREEALIKIWGDDNYFTTRSMDVFVTKLRKVLSGDPSVTILTVHGSGLKLIIQ